MGTPMIGMNAMFGLAEEVTWGSAVTPPTHWVPIYRHNVEPTLDIRAVPYLGVATAANQTGHMERDSVLLAHDVGGDIETTACYDSTYFALLCKHAFGAVATTGSGPYTHTFTLDYDGVVGLTGHAVDGVGLSNRAETFAGLKINTFELACDARDLMRVRLGVIGKSAGGMTSVSGTPAFTAAEEIQADHGATMSWNSDTYNLRSMRLVLNNNLVRRPYIGSTYTDAPVPGGFGEITFEATLPWELNDIYTDFLAGTQADGSIVFTGTSNNRLTITLSNLKWLSVSKPVDRAGELVMSVRGKCFANPSSEQGLTLALRNDNSSAI